MNAHGRGKGNVTLAPPGSGSARPVFADREEGR